MAELHRITRSQRQTGEPVGLESPSHTKKAEQLSMHAYLEVADATHRVAANLSSRDWSTRVDIDET